MRPEPLGQKLFDHCLFSAKLGEMLERVLCAFSLLPFAFGGSKATQRELLDRSKRQAAHQLALGYPAKDEHRKHG